jgi:hypothetical protein
MRHAVLGFDGPGKALEGTPNALVGKRLIALDECRRADHIGV